ncbi:hypothetical protein NQZ68_019221 [Dissostichus eleginoides]|nr:hypothetical protein NQZ68_019221 [Dissostichus eleginoides]
MSRPAVEELLDCEPETQAPTPPTGPGPDCAAAREEVSVQTGLPLTPGRSARSHFRPLPASSITARATDGNMREHLLLAGVISHHIKQHNHSDP